MIRDRWAARRGSETATPGSIDGRRTPRRRRGVVGAISRGHHGSGSTKQKECARSGYSSNGKIGFKGREIVVGVSLWEVNSCSNGGR
ncbi:hypothetical protein V6N11_051933 [Hibiscus sabdariffa]|uniref:Uncharacterized protein n=1 Tax=Hibiscus sabdariffa TaxID=183260 RepID=A0ABR2U8H3_9ROSI